MRLSEAIRKGSAIVPQTFRRRFEYDGQGNVIAACAVGAASLAIGAPSGTGIGQMDAWLDAVGPLAEAGAFPGIRCPECADGGELAHLWQLAVHLNDHHSWTREAIADYAQAQEAAHGVGQDETPIQRATEKREPVLA